MTNLTFLASHLQLHRYGSRTPRGRRVLVPLERAESVVRCHARLQGYVCSYMKEPDKRKPPTARRRDLRCSKGGVKRGKGVLRQTGTRMSECPFEIRIFRTQYGAWKVQVHNGDHNHDASINDSEHSEYRRPTDMEVSSSHLTQSRHATGYERITLLGAIRQLLSSRH
jgi:hypothetical protein